MPSYILLIRASLAGKHFEKAHQSADLTVPLSERPADAVLHTNPLVMASKKFSHSKLVRELLKAKEQFNTEGITHSVPAHEMRQVPCSAPSGGLCHSETSQVGHITLVSLVPPPGVASMPAKLKNTSVKTQVPNFLLQEPGSVFLPCFHSTTAPDVSLDSRAPICCNKHQVAHGLFTTKAQQQQAQECG